MAYVCLTLPRTRRTDLVNSELNVFAMSLGPGKHLKGLKLMNGLVTPEEVWLVAFYRAALDDLTRDI
jgi:hypothetical protein